MNSEVRVHNQDIPFAQISRSLLQDSGLSFACRGMLAYLLSKSTDWICKTYDIEREGDIGREARRSLFMEAEMAGYLAFRKIKQDDGTFLSFYDFYRAPLPENERTRSWETGNYKNGKGVKNKRLKFKLQPDTGFLHPVNPAPVDPAPVDRPPYMRHDSHEKESRKRDIPVREESLKPSLDAAASQPVLPLLSLAPVPENNQTTDRAPLPVHSVRETNSFEAGGMGGGGIASQLPATAPGGTGSGVTPQALSAIQSSSVSASKTKAPRANKTAKLPLDPRSSHPAIAILRKIASRFPDKALWDKLIHLLGDSPNEAKLESCYLEHIERGYNKNSWKWATEWYLTGIPDQAINRNKPKDLDRKHFSEGVDLYGQIAERAKRLGMESLK